MEISEPVPIYSSCSQLKKNKMNRIKFGYLVLIALSFSKVSYSQYDSYQRNADGSYAVGGCYDSYQRNADGSYAVGGAYDSYQRNPDGTYVVGGAYDSYQRNPDGTYVVGWGKCKK